MGLQYVAGTQDFKGAGRITQSELQQDAPSQSTMGQLNQSQDDFNKGMNDYRKQIAQHRANLFGKAQMLDDPSLSDEDYATYVNQIYKPGGALGQKSVARNIPDFSKMSESDADAAFNALPSGKVFIGPDGKPHKRTDMGWKDQSTPLGEDPPQRSVSSVSSEIRLAEPIDAA